jgi:DNA polymerase III subunit alpha
MELIPEFIRRRQGEVTIEYEHPLLEPICRETYGIMVYQEQVMQAAQVLAGYTLGGADLLAARHGQEEGRGNGRPTETFVEGCAKVNGIPAAKANRSSICSRSSPATASTNRTPPLTPWSLTRPPI